MRSRCKALLDGETETVISASCCAPVQRVAGGCVAAADYRCEAAGAAFTARFEAKASSEDDAASSIASDEDDSPSREEESHKDSKEKKAAAGGYLRISELLKGVQLYELMGISEGASQDEIKKAYRSLALNHHPDKQAAMEPEEAKKVEENFIKIQEAYELLSDPVKRQQYDSSLDFDESLPKFRPGDDFFQVFGEAFRRNARFSKRKPVPDLGTAEDEPRKWKKFYEFWNGYQSWRDPVILAQNAGEEICDLAEAECREERRWMQRENEKVARRYKQQERDRIAKLVSLAEAADPRVQAEVEAKKQARAAEAARREEERTAVKRAKEEAERKQREAEEAARKAEEEKRKAEKAARDTVKERVKKCRQRLRGFHQAVKQHVVLDQVNEVCLQFQEDELRSLGDRIDEALKGKDVFAAAELFHEAIKSIGLVPMKVSEDAVSTTSGPTDSQEDSQITEEQRQMEEQRQRRAEENKAKREKELERQAEERAKIAAEKAEEKKKKEEQRKKEQAAAEAARKKQEKNEEQKARKAEEKQKKQEEQEKLRREQQKEESRLRAIEQSEKDKQQAQQKKQEMELERLVQMFSQDRVNRLTKLDAMSDEKLSASLQEAIQSDAALAGAFKLLVEAELETEHAVDRGMTLVYQLGVWGLALPTPQHIRPENAVRNRAKKGRKRLSDTMANFLKSCSWDNVEVADASAWQQGIVDGSVEIPFWSQELAAEPTPETTEVKGEKEKEVKKEKKGKKDKSKDAEEDLDQILAELETPGSKKKGKKGKN